jgi:hypothetical protein
MQAITTDCIAESRLNSSSEAPTVKQRATDWIIVRSDVDEFDRVTDFDRFPQAVKKRLEQFRQEFVTVLQGLGF